MKPLLVLLIVSILAGIGIYLIDDRVDVAFAGRIGLSAMLVFTAGGHFAFTKGMAAMIPDFIPFKTGMVYLTGVLELAGAIGIHIPALRDITGWCLIIFFVVLLPANINAAMRHIDYEKGTTDGNGPRYLWFRVPLQILFIVWTYGCTISLLAQIR
ncbi:DoxX family protein [Spirosoma sp. KUDC1026]|uniref:DoxX family protein n=1 Tax=Spirosoma sp. KUDC1026 TaxID=2745947 RepID=UPI00159BB347|nr:hypothetical protein [Spirosoma sp. KUDC1026]QKZ14235.1 hypothetical protein HU175_17010 [Spirosoma sp. KUDC1026]